MTHPRSSLVIVSRARPRLLALCLTACAQLRHPALEIIVVTDSAGVAAAQAHPLGPQLKIVPFYGANISAARNLGITHAAGDIIAFIDDDAIPEPLWLWHLTRAFDDPDVAAATGFTRRPNGMRLQSGAAWALPDGRTQPFDLPSDAVRVVAPEPGHAIKTEGTNMAFRRNVLIALHGFDENFRFYLDETDLNLRLAQAGHATAIVPMAQVVHGTAPGPLRNRDRVPTDLFEPGRSLAIFARKHGGGQPAIDTERATRRTRLLRAMNLGQIAPADVNRLLARFDAGVAEGISTPKTNPDPLHAPARDFRPLPPRPFTPHVLAGRFWNRRAWRKKAARMAQKGTPVTLLLLSRTAIFHRERFDKAGFWEQRGGLFGRSQPKDPLFRFWSFRSRVARETENFRLRRGA